MARVRLIATSIVLSLVAARCDGLASMEACEYEYGRMLHRETRYLAGRVYQDGSIFGTCHHGILTCHEDHALADAPLSEHTQVTCSSELIGSRRRRLGLYVADNAKTWPNGVVHYRIAGSFTDEQHGHITQAMTNVVQQSGINVQFVDCESSECGESFIDFGNSKKGCFSKVGFMNQGAQAINLADSCFKSGPGTPMHEILHALGVRHEHSHPERQVVVLTDMKLPVAVSNYVKNTEDRTTAYDLGSIMHYSRKAGLCVPSAITSLDSFCDVTNPVEGCVQATKEHCDESRDDEFGQRKALSAGDIEVLRNLYANADTPHPAEHNYPQPSNPRGATRAPITPDPAPIDPFIDVETPEIWD